MKQKTPFQQSIHYNKLLHISYIEFLSLLDIHTDIPIKTIEKENVKYISLPDCQEYLILHFFSHHPNLPYIYSLFELQKKPNPISMNFYNCLQYCKKKSIPTFILFSSDYYIFIPHYNLLFHTENTILPSNKHLTYILITEHISNFQTLFQKKPIQYFLHESELNDTEKNIITPQTPSIKLPHRENFTLFYSSTLFDPIRICYDEKFRNYVLQIFYEYHTHFPKRVYSTSHDFHLLTQFILDIHHLLHSQNIKHIHEFFFYSTQIHTFNIENLSPKYKTFLDKFHIHTTHLLHILTQLLPQFSIPYSYQKTKKYSLFKILQ